MKKINIQLFILIAAALIFTSCGKDGAVGPAGATGPQGATGAAGPAGANGSIIYSGTSDPVTTTGAVGDYYINLSSGLLYGPKTTSGWGTGVSLKGAAGATGAAGAAGSQILNGTGAPALTVGKAGDYYLDKTNYLLYGPKTSTAWGTPLNLQGPAGSNLNTDVFTIGGSDWLWNSQYEFETSPGGYTEYFTRYYVHNNTNITQSALDNGLILVYITPSPVDHPNQWEPMPYQFDGGFGYSFNYVFVTDVGKVTLQYFFIRTNTTSTLPTLSTYNDISRKFKIVILTSEMSAAIKAHHIDVKNYNEVSKITGLWKNDKLSQ